MAFTNIWDDTYPPDTQFANQLGADLRNFRLDTQQRMASISGLDANKPNFAGDVQPVSWNGILYFATDTGNIYQFNNPVWTNVTSALTTKTNALKAVNQVVHTGTTTMDTIYTLNLPANILGVNGRARMTFVFRPTSIAGGCVTEITFGGTVIGTGNFIAGWINNQIKVVLEGGNTGATNTQRWNGHMFVPGQVVQVFGISTTSAIDTTVGVAVTVAEQSSANSDSQTFDFFTLEFF